MLRFVQGQTRDFLEENMAHICASLESAVVEVLVKKAVHALEASDLDVLAVVGGVSANRHLRERLAEEGGRRGFRPLFPAPRYCGDNGAMVAAIAQVKANLGIRDEAMEVAPSLRWA
jgi:N6-L-threonylcarbamoyladenine synthase